jgi:hypothetical protein
LSCSRLWHPPHAANPEPPDGPQSLPSSSSSRWRRAMPFFLVRSPESIFRQKLLRLGELTKWHREMSGQAWGHCRTMSPAAAPSSYLVRCQISTRAQVYVHKSVAMGNQPFKNTPTSSTVLGTCVYTFEPAPDRLHASPNPEFSLTLILTTR